MEADIQFRYATVGTTSSLMTADMHRFASMWLI